MNKHQDCRNYIPIDVEKGICNALQTEVPASMDGCPNYIMMPKCKNCGNFQSVQEDGLGECAGFNKSYWAYADLRSTQCEGYLQA
jgi:4-hydroxyphenylacetate decarboxylase small subunit